MAEDTEWLIGVATLIEKRNRPAGPADQVRVTPMALVREINQTPWLAEPSPVRFVWEVMVLSRVKKAQARPIPGRLGVDITVVDEPRVKLVSDRDFGLREEAVRDAIYYCGRFDIPISFWRVQAP